MHVLQTSKAAPERVCFSGGTPHLPRALVCALAASATLGAAVLAWKGLHYSHSGGKHSNKGVPDCGIHETLREGEDENLFALVGPPRLFSSKPDAPKGQGSQALPSNAADGKGARAAGVLSDRGLRTSDIMAREKELNLARALLHRVEDVEYEESSGDETPSDETDVSLNYCTATELELKSRDELMEAFWDYQSIQQSGVGSVDEKDGQATINDMGMVLAKIVEYLDISNEREKLRVRREAKRYEERRKTLQTITSLSDDALPRLSEALPDLGLGAHDSRQGPARGAITSSKQLSTLDRMLQARDNHEEELEENWGTDDDEEEVFMEYLQQDDAALKFFTREEVRRNREIRLRPSSQNCIDDDVHVVAANGQDFNDIITDINGKIVSDMDDDMDDDFDYDSYDKNFPVEGEDEPTNSWSNSEKAEFEANIIHFLHNLAEAMGVTELLVERETLQFDAENEQRREARKQLAVKQATKTPYKTQRGDDDSEDEWEDADDCD